MHVCYGDQRLASGVSGVFCYSPTYALAQSLTEPRAHELARLTGQQASVPLYPTTRTPNYICQENTMQIEIMKESVSYTDIIPWCFKARKSVTIGASEMAQKLKAPVASQSILMILVPEPHMTGENQLSDCPLVSTHTPWCVHMHTHTQIHMRTHTYICTHTYTLWSVHTHTRTHTHTAM